MPPTRSAHPANRALDETPKAEELPTTQHEAAQSIQERKERRNHFEPPRGSLAFFHLGTPTADHLLAGLRQGSRFVEWMTRTPASEHNDDRVARR